MNIYIFKQKIALRLALVYSKPKNCKVEFSDLL